MKVFCFCFRWKYCGDWRIRPGCSVKKLFVQISQNSQENICTGVCFQPTTLLKKRIRHMCFSKNFTKSLRTPFLYHNCKRLLLYNWPHKTWTSKPDSNLLNYATQKMNVHPKILSKLLFSESAFVTLILEWDFKNSELLQFKDSEFKTFKDFAKTVNYFCEKRQL